MNKIRVWLSHPYLPTIVVLLAVLLTAPSLWNGFCFDYYLQRLVLMRDNPISQHIPATPWNLFCFHKGDEDHTRTLIYEAAFPWWMDGIRFRAYFFRPISSLSHWMDYLLWPDSPLLMHAQSILWYAALVGFASLLYRRIMGTTWAAGLAALLYALDDAHGFPAGWLANRNALLPARLVFCVFLHTIVGDRKAGPLEQWFPLVIGVVALSFIPFYAYLPLALILTVALTIKINYFSPEEIGLILMSHQL